MIKTADAGATATQEEFTIDHNESCNEGGGASSIASEDESSTIVATTSTATELIEDFSKSQNHTLESTVRLLRRLGEERGIVYARTLSLDPSDNTRLHKGNWHDPTRTPLPYAPNMKIYCFYGHGIDTERTYKYKRNDVESTTTTTATTTTTHDAGGTATSGNDHQHHDHDQQQESSSSSSSSSTNQELPFIMDSEVEDAVENIQYGAKMGDGDASVSIVSLGYVCADEWRRTDGSMNPSKIPVVTREYRHQEEFVMDDPIRGGPLSADHVDILGNADMTEDILRVVTDFESETVQDKFTSNILEIVEDVKKRRAKRRDAAAAANKKKYGFLYWFMERREVTNAVLRMMAFLKTNYLKSILTSAQTGIKR